MFILRPSSPLKIAEPRPAAELKIIDAAQAAGPDEHFVDTGLPLPESYDKDIVRALLQDPFRIFIYWEVRQESLSALTRYFSPQDAASFKVVLRLKEIEGDNEAFFEVARRGRYWMLVFPDREYEFEIGVRSASHGYISLIRSNRVRTPRGTISPVTAQERQYHSSTPEFIRVLEASGFAAEQALNMTIAAKPGAGGEASLLLPVLDRLPAPVRQAVLIAGEGGALTAEQIDALPEPLRSELAKLVSSEDGRLASVGLMHYLPELLREIIEDDHEWIGDHIHPLHIGQRFFLGGTENLTWPGGEIHLPRLPRRPGSDAIYSYR